MIFFSELFGKNSSLCFFFPSLDLCRDGATTISSIVRSVIWFMVPSRLFALLLLRGKLPKCRRMLPGVGVRSSELSQLEALSFWVSGELMKREKESFDTWANWTLSLNKQLSLWMGKFKIPLTLFPVSLFLRESKSSRYLFAETGCFVLQRCYISRHSCFYSLDCQSRVWEYHFSLFRTRAGFGSSPSMFLLLRCINAKKSLLLAPLEFPSSFFFFSYSVGKSRSRIRHTTRMFH